VKDINVLSKIEQVQRGKEMMIPKITTFASPKNISFRKFEHNEELFKKDTPEKPTGEGRKEWTHKHYKPLHRI
jgi:hypothetical protein